MAALIDTISNRKLIAFGVLLLLAQIVFFIIGGTIAPSPSNVSNMLATKCRDDHKGGSADRWFYPRGKDKTKTCKQVYDLEDEGSRTQLTANDLVFAVQFPLPREGSELTMSRWFQNMLGVLHPEIAYQGDGESELRLTIELHARIGYRDIGDPEDAWKEIDRSIETRLLECDIEDKRPDYLYNCTPMTLFELGSTHHDFYLLNLRLPNARNANKSSQNQNLGKLQDLWIIEIHQNGGFTRVLFAVKTFLFPILLSAVVWFWTRIQRKPKAPRLLEKMLFALGLSFVLLDVPIEWLTLAFDIPAMILISDIRQGICYSMLFAFWIIFAGEYQLDDIKRDSIVMYWKHLSAVAFGCICLFVFDICARGVQLHNAFWSIWATQRGANVAQAFLIVAATCACIYVVFLGWMVGKSVWNMRLKRRMLATMDEKRRKHHQVMIFRFQFLLVTTLVCAALTVIGFIMGRVSEGSWRWGDEDGAAGLEYTSAFFIGVFAMGNLYTTALLILYSPSSKHDKLENTLDAPSEEVALNRIPPGLDSGVTEVSTTEFIQKLAID